MYQSSFLQWSSMPDIINKMTEVNKMIQRVMKVRQLSISSCVQNWIKLYEKQHFKEHWHHTVINQNLQHQISPSRWSMWINRLQITNHKIKLPWILDASIHSQYKFGDPIPDLKWSSWSKRSIKEHWQHRKSKKLSFFRS